MFEMIIATTIVTVEIVCPFCGAVHTVDVCEDDFEAWQNGALTQDAFPYLGATAREQLISQLCPDCQKKFFGEF